MKIEEILKKYPDRLKAEIGNDLREFAKLKAKEAIEVFERYNEEGAPLDMGAVIKYIKEIFDIK